MPSTSVSAGLLLYRKRGKTLEVFLAHPGGPFFSNKDDGHWTIPKGEMHTEEQGLATALREFEEEVGFAIATDAQFFELGSVRQKGGKTVYAWAVEGDCPSGHCLKSNVFRIEWPPRSGKLQEFPEIDRAEFFDVETARRKINPAQTPFLDRLAAALNRQ